MFGFSEAEALGKNSQNLLQPSYAPGEREKIIDELNRKGTSRCRIRIKHRNGTEIIADLNATQITDENENVTGYVVTYRDITKQKHMEDAFKQQHEELQTIFDTVPASIFYKDKENRIIRVNQAFTKLMGLTKEELEGKSLFELYPKEQAEPYWEDDKDVITLGKQKLNIIESVDTKKGLRWVQTHKIPYRDNFGKIIGVVGFTTDITERKQAEEQLPSESPCGIQRISTTIKEKTSSQPSLKEQTSLNVRKQKNSYEKPVIILKICSITRTHQ